MQPAADAAVLTLGVLAHADHVDVGGAAPGQRRRDAREQAHRSQVDPLAEALPQRQDQLSSRYVIGDSRITNRAEVDRVKLHQAIDPVLVHHAAALQVVVTSPWDLRELAAEAALLGGKVEHVDAGGNHFLADTVTRNHCNSMSVHVDRLEIITPTNAMPAAM